MMAGWVFELWPPFSFILRDIKCRGCCWSGAQRSLNLFRNANLNRPSHGLSERLTHGRFMLGLLSHFPPAPIGVACGRQLCAGGWWRSRANHDSLFSNWRASSVWVCCDPFSFSMLRPAAGQVDILEFSWRSGVTLFTSIRASGPKNVETVSQLQWTADSKPQHQQHLFRAFPASAPWRAPAG